jgi:glycosyltransferase involved in cell wall biosynthesis
MEPINLSIFFPVYNESKNIDRLYRRTKSTISALQSENLISKYEIIFINDGSKDDSVGKIKKILKNDNNVRLIQLKRNYGYGRALKEGFAAAKMDFVFFSDADCQFDLDELKKFIPPLKENDFVIGFRIVRKDSFFRRIYGILYNKLIKLRFQIKVRDVNCAFKIFKRQILTKIDLKSNGALVSAELLTKLHLNENKFAEVGVTHFPRKYGKQKGANLIVIFYIFKELFKLKI